MMSCSSPAHEPPSEKGPLLNEKKFAPKRSKFFKCRSLKFKKDSNSFELPPLKAYQFPKELCVQSCQSFSSFDTYSIASDCVTNI